MNKSIDWSTSLFIIQAHMNNIITSLKKTSIKIVYDFSSIQFWNFLKDFINSDISRTKKEIVDFMTWIQMSIKHIYDKRHQSLNVKFDDYVFLRLHKEYNISIIKTLWKKLFDQYADFFKIIEKIENLAYRLSFSHHWKIHSVISVTQIESISNSFFDSFHRSRSEESESIHMKKNIDKIKFFEIDKLINKQFMNREVEHLVRWKKYESQYDEWRSISKLQNVLKLINDYEKFMNNTIFLLNRLSRDKFVMKSFISTLSHEFFKNSKIAIKSTNTSSIINSAVNVDSDQNFVIRRFTRKKISSRERDDIF
jgi:hypothetical protein